MNSNDTIQHFGIKGMRWGHRNRREALTKKYISKGYNPKAAREKATKRVNTEGKLKKAALIGGGVALAGLAAYGGYKGVKHLQAKQAERLAKFLKEQSARDSRNKQLRDSFKDLDKAWGGTHEVASAKSLFNKADAAEKRYGKTFDKVKSTVQDSTKTIRDRHKFAGSEMKKVFDNIRKEDPAHTARMSKMNADIDSMLNDLLGKGSTSRRGANGRRIKDVTNSLKG